MRLALQRWLDSPRTIMLASATTLAMGLFFVFVWAPHPWSWRGIDQYDELARALARGEPFGTTDVPWGYAYFIAFFYSLFPNLPWAPVTVQVVINALVPVLLYRLARPAVGHRIAALAAWIAALFSFNTIYASTQTSDSICTVLFLASLLCFVHAHRTSSTWAFAAAGVLSGLTPQFRPNMILLPAIVIPVYAVLPPRSRLKVINCVVLLLCTGLMLVPWTVRNFRYTNTFQPTSTHSGIQLWYGTLQIGPYLESRAHNPRSAFASAPFDYTSLDAPIMVAARIGCGDRQREVRLRYRTDRDATWRDVAGTAIANGRFEYSIPAQAAPSTVYLFFEAGGQTYPHGGDREPLIYFVSRDHLGDLDSNHEILDVFDLGRLMRHLAWGDALPVSDRLDLQADGTIDRADLAKAVEILLPQVRGPYAGFEGNDRAVLTLSDGSTLAMPRQFGGRQTDLEVLGNLAGALVSRHVAFSMVRPTPAPAQGACFPDDEIAINEVFYRREPHEMRRYTALAIDNIARDPLAYARASAYRMIRLFIVRSGTDDEATAYQYAGSSWLFNAGFLLSSAYFAIFLFGVVIAWRRRSPWLYALIPIAYVPLTICFVLTNMRYTITVQPLMFVFVAIAIATVLRLETED